MVFVYHDIVETLKQQTEAGRSDEEVIVEIYRSGEGQAPLSFAYAEFRGLTNQAAFAQIRTWTNDIERPARPRRRSVFQRDIREILREISEGGE